MSTLITCALGAFAHKLKKRLPDEQVILGDYAEIPEIMIKRGQIIKLPHPKNFSYQHEMLALCLDNNIEIIYPLQEQEQHLLAESKLLFAEYGIILKDIPSDIQ